MRRELASNRTTKPEVLYFLAEDKSSDVRRKIAANVKTPRQAGSDPREGRQRRSAL